jgi:hypothetical protein
MRTFLFSFSPSLINQLITDCCEVVLPEKDTGMYTQGVPLFYPLGICYSHRQRQRMKLHKKKEIVSGRKRAV